MYRGQLQKYSPTAFWNPPIPLDTLSGMTPGARLRELREQRGWTLREVEKRAGLSNAYISQLETWNIQNPSPSVLRSLAEVYGKPYETLMRWYGYWP